MKHLEVLVVTDKIATPKVLNWRVSITNNIETAVERLQLQPYKVVAISNTFNETDKRKLSQLLPVLNSHSILVEFSDDKNLSESIKTAYWRKNKPSFKRNYLDNSFEIKLVNSVNLN